MTFIGIDVGAKGGIAVIDGDKVYAFPYSNDKLKEILKIYQETELLCYVEEQWGFSKYGVKQGTKAIFSLGKSYGTILGMLQALDIPYQVIPAKTWKKEFCLNSDKRLSIEVCKALYPKLNLLPTERCKKESDGMAEATLIATYAQRATRNENIM